MPAVTAIIPTRDRPDLLADCLASLLAQDVRPGALEVVVIDDGSEPPLADVVSLAGTSRVRIRYHRQEPAGLNPGRNRGAEIASAPVLAYLDDDTIVDPQWAAAVVDAFEREACDGLAGRIRLRFEAAVPRWLAPTMYSYLSELDLGDDPRWLTNGTLPFGANCAVTAEAWRRVSGFRVGLDRVGDSLLSGGETDFYGRLLRNGGRILYWPAAAVEHRIPASRLQRSWMRRRARAQGVGDALAASDQQRTPLTAFLRDLARTGRVAPILAKGIMTGRGVFGAQLWLNYCGGRFSAHLARARREAA